MVASVGERETEIISISAQIIQKRFPFHPFPFTYMLGRIFPSSPKPNTLWLSPFVRPAHLDVLARIISTQQQRISLASPYQPTLSV